VDALCPLPITFAELFSQITLQCASVHLVLDLGLASVLAPRLSLVASRQRDELLLAMASMRLTEATDERSLPLCSRSGGRLRTAVLYNLCMFGGMLDEHHAFVWRHFAPSKVRFFGWLLVKSRIQC
jgi:hypothetical protein